MTEQPNVGLIAVIVGFCSTLVTAAGAVVAFKPRVIRIEKDIEKLDDEKADRPEVEALRTLMNTRFDAQGREIGELKTEMIGVRSEMKKVGEGVTILLNRNGKSRRDDEG